MEIRDCLKSRWFPLDTRKMKATDLQRRCACLHQICASRPKNRNQIHNFPPSHFLFHLPVTLIRTPQSFNSKKTQKIPLWGRLRRPLMIDQLRNANNSTRLGMDVNKTQPPPLYISFSTFLSRLEAEQNEMLVWHLTFRHVWRLDVPSHGCD